MKIEIINKCENKLPIIITKRLLLRDIEVKDISDEYVNWLNNPEITKFLEIRFKKQKRNDVEDYLNNALNNIKTTNHFGIYDNNGTRLIGTVTLPTICWNHLYSDISFVIGHPNVPKGQGYATEAVKSVVYYAFTQLKLKKLWAGYYADHIASKKVLKKVGFKEEGRMRCHLIDYDGHRVDKILVGLLSCEFFTLQS